MKKFVAPELETKKFDLEDILTASGIIDETEPPEDTIPTQDEDEGVIV